MSERMPLPSRKDALNAGAARIEAALHGMRDRARKYAQECPDGPMPLTTSHEMDLMQAAELASSAAILRMMAETETPHV